MSKKNNQGRQEQFFLPVNGKKHTISRTLMHDLQAEERKTQAELLRIEEDLQDVLFSGTTDKMRIKIAFTKEGEPRSETLERDLLEKLEGDHLILEFMKCCAIAAKAKHREKESRVREFIERKQRTLGNKVA